MPKIFITGSVRDEDCVAAYCQDISDEKTNCEALSYRTVNLKKPIENNAARRSHLLRDNINRVKHADVLILLMSEDIPDTYLLDAYVLLGVALAKRETRIIVIGHKREILPLFFSTSQIMCVPTWEDAKANVKDWMDHGMCDSTYDYVSLLVDNLQIPSVEGFDELNLTSDEDDQMSVDIEYHFNANMPLYEIHDYVTRRYLWHEP